MKRLSNGDSMKERPILFSDPMVSAILEGRKTQTRRVVKPIPQIVTDRNTTTWDCDAAALMRLFDQAGRTCPYGQTGDRLWVRKTRACRIQLEITSVRVERLQDISEADARAEGISSASKNGGLSTKYAVPSPISPGDRWDEFCSTPIHAFKFLWESINGADSWGVNPWVWVIEFKRVQS